VLRPTWGAPGGALTERYGTADDRSAKVTGIAPRRSV